MKRFLKIIAYSFIALFILSGAAWFIGKKYIEEIILHRLRVEVEATFGKYYHIDYKEIKTGITSEAFSIKIINPIFTTDTSQTLYLGKYPVINFKADSFEVGGINIRKLFFGQKIELKIIGLYNPQLVVLTKKLDHKKEVKKENSLFKNRKLIEEIEVQKLHIEKGNINFLNLQNAADTLYYGADINLDVVNAKIPTQAEVGIYEASKIENIIFSMNNVKFNPKNSPYEFLISSIQFNAQQNSLRCRHVQLIPEESLLKMSKTNHYQKTFAQIDIGNINLRGMNYDKLGIPALEVKHVEIANSTFSLLRNRNKLLDKSVYKKSLQEALHSIKIPLKIDTLYLRNLYLIFKLHLPNHKEPANINIHHINAILTKIDNDKNAKHCMKFTAQAVIMKSGKLTFNATFPLNNNTHQYTGTISSMPFSEWNQVISKLADVQITSGKIKQIQFNGTATAMDTKGKIIFEYNDLQATLFKKDKKGGLKKAVLLTHVANNFLRLRNPSNGEAIPLSKDYYYKREPWQGQIMLWVGGLLDGIEATLLNEYLKKKVDHQEKKMIEKRKR